MSLISQDYLTAEELAELKGVTRRTVYSWIREGIAPATERFAGRYWFEKREAERFVPPKPGPKGRPA